MGKYLIIFVCFFLASCNLSSSTDIDCGYGDNGNYQGILGYLYQCEVENDPNINTKESTAISAVTGTHRTSKSSQSVFGIRAEGKTMKYFPQGLEKFFENLKVIDFYRVGMVEIHQADLKPFPNLVVLYLGFNKVKVLESGLFDHNPKLEVIAFPHNELKYVYGNIFDHLSKLSRFWFKGNECINKEFNDRDEMPTAIEYVKENCPSEDTSSEELVNNDQKKVESSDEIYSSGEYTVAPGESGQDSENDDNMQDHLKLRNFSNEYTAAPGDSSEESKSTKRTSPTEDSNSIYTEGIEASTGHREQCAYLMIFGFVAVIVGQIAY